MGTSLFISYSRTDMVETDWMERLKMYLAPLQRAGTVDTWDDSRIETGTNWRQQIDKALENAGAAILLGGRGFALHIQQSMPRDEAQDFLGALVLQR